MNILEKVADLVTGGRASAPTGTIKVVDPHGLNWLYITYNTIEELVRVAPKGTVEPAAMRSYRWVDDRTLEVDVREGNRFHDGEALTAAAVKRSFDELMRWKSPHPPGTHFNLAPETRCEVTGEYQVRLHLPAPDGLALGKLRGMHIASTRFWDSISFGYARNNSGEGHW